MPGELSGRLGPLGGVARRAAASIPLLLLVLLGAHQLRALRRENINWDEFALLDRAAKTIRSGDLQGGGRPGLTVLVLVPFVSGCGDSVRAIVTARHLWLGFTIAAVIGLWFLIRRFGAGAAPTLAAMTLTMVPVWLRWSLQVRTDQPAIAAALWGGVALVASRKRPALALAAGALCGLACLFTQKALYVVGLVGAVTVIDHLTCGEVQRRRELTRAAALVVGAAAVLLAYLGLVRLLYRPPTLPTLERQLAIFDYYRTHFGFRAYRGMLPSLRPHAMLFALLLVGSIDALVRRTADRRRLAGAWLCLGLGLGVGWFHSAAFPYFWMTLGLFPAVALGLSWPAVAVTLRRHTPHLSSFLVIGLGIYLLHGGVASALHRWSQDTQRPQRQAMAFIQRNFSSRARGFQAESALFCRRDPDPLPVYFVHRILAMTEKNNAELVREFRERPIAFLIAHRFTPFARSVQGFLESHYVLYRDEVLVPGQRIRGPASGAGAIDIHVPGAYRWRVLSGAPGRLAVDGQPLVPGQVVSLDRGVHRLALLDDVSHGMLALDLRDPPAAVGAPFYAWEVVSEIAPPYQPPWTSILW